MKSLAPNTLLQNRYLIVHLIGKGGMGDVYLAVDQRLGSAVAIKRTLHGDNEMLGEAFEREARTLARLRHPALPKVSDHFIENENQYLVMEHIAGDDLAKRLTATQKPFPLSWVLFWADQLLDALAYLHSHEPPIIHRDIKPQNLKLTDDNNIVLLDFGLSKNSNASSVSNPSIGSGSTGSVVGYTPHYAPMEQVRGTGTNPRSDIYSLSATLYQLLTNVVPPDALSRADYLLSGKDDPLKSINQVNAEIPKAISDVILKGLSISQDQRFADAREMQKVLRETYASLQTDPKPVAFETPEVVNASQPAVTVLDSQPEKSSPAQSQNQTDLKNAMGAATIPFGMLDADSVESLTNSQKANATGNVQNFDATLPINYDSNPVTLINSEPKVEARPIEHSEPLQSNLKTEVFNNDFAANYQVENKQAAQNQNFAPENKPVVDEQKFDSTPNITGDKTVPLIEFEKNHPSVDLAQTQPASAFNSMPKAETFPPSAPVYDSKPEQFAPAQTKPVEKKKSNGVLFGVLGGLVGLILLVVIGGGAAWYFMNQTDNSGITNVATPTPAPSVSPTVEQTPEQVNANSASNSNSDIVTTASPDNTAISENSNSATNSVVTQQTPLTQPTRTGATPKPVITTNTPKPSATKVVVKTEPTPKKVVRGTDIPQ